MIEILLTRDNDKGSRSDDETGRSQLLPNQLQQIKYVCGIE